MITRSETVDECDEEENNEDDIYNKQIQDTLETAVHTAAAGWNARLAVELVEVSTEE